MIEVMNEPKKKPGKRKPPQRTGTPLFAYITPELEQALQKYLDETSPRVSKTAAIEAAVIEFLKLRGYWPHTSTV